MQQKVDAGDLNATQLNHYNLTRLLDDLILLDGDQTILSRLDFNNNLIVEEIWIDGSVNDVYTKDIAMADVNQTFSALQILERPKFAHLEVGGNVIMMAAESNGNLINSIDIRDIENRRVTKSTHQEITGKWNLSDATFQSAQVGTLNAIAGSDWNDEFIYQHSSGAQIISGPLIVQEMSIEGDVITTGGINGYKLNDISQSAADIREDIIIIADVSFEHIKAESLMVEGKLNGYSLGLLTEDAVVTNDTLITGRKIFDTIDVLGDVDAVEINGGRLMESYLHKNADQVIKASIKFAGPVRTDDLNLLSHATLNGLKSESLFSAEMLPYNIHDGDVILSHNVKVRDMKTESVLNENWDQLLHSLARVDTSNQFTAPVTFVNDLQVKKTFS